MSLIVEDAPSACQIDSRSRRSSGRSDSGARAAIDGASECEPVDEWFDLGYLSDVEIGECWDEHMDTVDCSTSHETEIYLQTEYPAARGEPYPGKATVERFATEQCEAAFAGYIGRDDASSSLEYVFLTPDEQGWKANDREILCAVQNLDGSPRTGSAHGSQL